MDQIRTTVPAPPDLPDDPVDVMPVFTSRRKAEKLPPLRPVASSNAFDPSRDKRLARADWQAGFLWGLVATVAGLCIVVTLAVGMSK